MPYTSRADGPLTAEEQDVAEALADYTTDGATRADWVPTSVLLGVYRAWLAEHHWRREWDDPDRLTPRQFGRALGRVYPRAEHCRRIYQGVQCRGYAWLRGPLSARSQPRHLRAADRRREAAQVREGCPPPV